MEVLEVCCNSCCMVDAVELDEIEMLTNISAGFIVRCDGPGQRREGTCEPAGGVSIHTATGGNTPVDRDTFRPVASDHAGVFAHLTWSETADNPRKVAAPGAAS